MRGIHLPASDSDASVRVGLVVWLPWRCILIRTRLEVFSSVVVVHHLVIWFKASPLSLVQRRIPRVSITFVCYHVFLTCAISANLASAMVGTVCEANEGIVAALSALAQVIVRMFWSRILMFRQEPHQALWSQFWKHVSKGKNFCNKFTLKS